MESTGNTGYFVREIKDGVGGVKIINPTQFKIISQSVKKTDKRDVKIIAKYLSLLLHFVGGKNPCRKS